MNKLPTENDERRVLVTARVSPRTMRFLRTIRAKNTGRALDALVTAHIAFLRAIRNRAEVSDRRMIQRQPSQLGIPEKK